MSYGAVVRRPLGVRQVIFIILLFSRKNVILLHIYNILQNLSEIKSLSTHNFINDMGARFSALVQTGPGAYPASSTMGTGSFLGVKRPGRGANHPPPSKYRGQERVGLYLYSPSGPSWPVMGAPLPLPYHIIMATCFDHTCSSSGVT